MKIHQHSFDNCMQPRRTNFRMFITNVSS